ncbi:uncharacterized protein [Lepisosteus oculatus]|uniref:uncharacterized protein n=1 Tax=Lepisosteus oculatus TaxID=7918 RepID=UPI0035F52CD7
MLSRIQEPPETHQPPGGRRSATEDRGATTSTNDPQPPTPPKRAAGSPPSVKPGPQSLSRTPNPGEPGQIRLAVPTPPPSRLDLKKQQPHPQKSALGKSGDTEGPVGRGENSGVHIRSPPSRDQSLHGSLCPPPPPPAAASKTAAPPRATGRALRRTHTHTHPHRKSRSEELNPEDPTGSPAPRLPCVSGPALRPSRHRPPPPANSSRDKTVSHPFPPKSPNQPKPHPTFSNYLGGLLFSLLLLLLTSSAGGSGM